MPARAISSGTISFGLVSIPVKVYTATSSRTVRFHMLHGEDHGRLRQQYVCSTCGEVVERDETVRGYEYARGQYVVMSDEELKALESRSDRSIEIEEFVPIAQVDPIYFEKSNLLGPDKGGQKAYKLLTEAMEASGKVAVGRFATRGRHPLVLIRPMGGGLVLHGLYYADEVRSFDDVEFGDPVDLKESERTLAKQLIDQLTSKRFQPDRYEDDYRREVLTAIDRKVAGQDVIAAPAPVQREQIIDLVAALKKSLKEAPAAGEKGRRARKPAKAKGEPAKAKPKGPKRRKSAS
jgi:DNA end-binding protein Ku